MCSFVFIPSSVSSSWQLLIFFQSLRYFCFLQNALRNRIIQYVSLLLIIRIWELSLYFHPCWYVWSLIGSFCKDITITESYSFICLYHNLFISSLVKGCLGYFQVLEITNKGSINVCVQIDNLWVLYFGGLIPSLKIFGLYVTCMYNCKQLPNCFSSDCTICIPPRNVWEL